MGKVFLSSDTHISHLNIMKYCNRPFSSIEEHDDTLINNWNATVSKHDDIYFLGDFCFSKDRENTKKIFNKLQGNKYCLKGNHDRNDVLQLPWAFIKDTYMLKYKDFLFWLSHYPHRSWPNSFHGSFHCYGHCHGSMPNYGKSCDVGVDCWNYKPVLIDDIIELLKNEQTVDHHRRDNHEL